MAINEQKYENVILYLIANMRDGMIHGKKKLAKLLYYVDFDRFEYKESMETITGDSYKHRPMGQCLTNSRTWWNACASKAESTSRKYRNTTCTAPPRCIPPTSNRT